MARLAVSDSRVFLMFMSAAAQRLGKSEKELWEGLLDQWHQRVSDPRILPAQKRTFHHLI